MTSQHEIRSTDEEDKQRVSRPFLAPKMHSLFERDKPLDEISNRNLNLEDEKQKEQGEDKNSQKNTKKRKPPATHTHLHRGI